MSINIRPAMARTAAIVVALGVTAVVGAPGLASAEVKSGAYTSTTWSSGTILLQRQGRVEGNELVLIGRYRIHETARGGYVDFFPGHRVFMNSDGHGGYSGPAYLGGAVVGRFTLTPRR